MAELPDASNATINATSYGPFCLQQEWFKSKVIGEEDCLFINVYIPEMKVCMYLLIKPCFIKLFLPNSAW